MKKHHTLPLAAFAAACLAAPAFGQITIVNPGFETPNVAPTGILANTVPTGWTGISASGQFVIGEDWTSGGAVIPSASSGDQSFLTNQTAGIYQSIGTVVANTDYSFSFEVGKRSNLDLPQNFEIGLWGDTNGDNDPDTALIELGISDLGTVPDGTTGQETMAVISSSVVNSSTFAPAAVGNDLFFYIRSAGSGSPPRQIVVDNVAAIPEPSAAAALLGGLGLTLVMLRRRRR